MFLSPRNMPETEHRNGTFGDYVRISSEFAFKIPDSPFFKGKEHLIAPLMCAGVTVYAPFKEFNIRPGEKVAILGVGGLGHLAMKFARSFGCQVFALSGTADKEKACMEMGAHVFVHSGRPVKPGENCYLMPVAAGQFAPRYDYILMCQGGGNVKWASLVGALAPNGTIAVMGNPSDHGSPAAASAPAAAAPAAAAAAPDMDELAKSTAAFVTSLIRFGHRVCGCASGSRAAAFEMLQFCALHGILPTCETFKWNEIHTAMKKIEDGTIRFRAVLLHPENK